MPRRRGTVVVSSAAKVGAAEATIPPSCRGEREWEWGQARAGRAPFQVTSPYHPSAAVIIISSSTFLCALCRPSSYLSNAVYMTSRR